MREQTPPARRRWFRFSLRTLLVLVMCMSIFCGYLGWALQWKRQRHTYLSSNQFDSWLTLQCAAAFEEQPAPWSLRIINEQGVSCLCFESSDQQELVKVSHLFPEAKIYYLESINGSMRSEAVIPEGEELSIDQLPYYQNGVLFGEGFLRPVSESTP